MNIELTFEELDTLIESLTYSQRAIRDARDTPYDVRKQKLASVDSVATKLREARQEITRV
jgi:hypothetical protein